MVSDSFESEPIDLTRTTFNSQFVQTILLPPQTRQGQNTNIIHRHETLQELRMNSGYQLLEL